MATSSNSLIPWRNPIRGPLLINAMFRLAVVRKIYLKFPGEKLKWEDRWQQFAEELFKQPEFLGLEGSYRAVKDQFNLILKERARFHGWQDANGGVTGNISTKDGHQLDELDQNVKLILMDIEQKKAERNLSTVLNSIDSSIIIDSLNSDSTTIRKKRKETYLHLPARSSTPTSSNSDSSSSTKKISLEEVLVDFIQDSKKFKSTVEVDSEQKLLRFFRSRSVESILREVGILNDKNKELLEMISIKILINVFCCDRQGFQADYFKNELVSYGMERLVAHKLHYYLTETLKSLNCSIEEKPEDKVNEDSPISSINLIAE